MAYDITLQEKLRAELRHFLLEKQGWFEYQDDAGNIWYHHPGTDDSLIPIIGGHGSSSSGTISTGRVSNSTAPGAVLALPSCSMDPASLALQPPSVPQPLRVPPTDYPGNEAPAPQGVTHYITQMYVEEPSWAKEMVPQPQIRSMVQSMGDVLFADDDHRWPPCSEAMFAARRNLIFGYHKTKSRGIKFYRCLCKVCSATVFCEVGSATTEQDKEQMRLRWLRFFAGLCRA